MGSTPLQATSGPAPARGPALGPGLGPGVRAPAGRESRERFGDDLRAGGAPVGKRVGPEHQGLQGVQWRGGAHPTGGVGPGGRAAGCEAQSPPGSLLDAVVSPAQGEQVACRGAADRPGPHVVEVAEPGGDRAAREAAATVAGADQRHELSTRSVGVGGEVVARVEAGAGQRVARHELWPSALCASPRARRALREVVAQPGAAHEQRLGRPCPLHLDQVVVVTADPNVVDRRGGVAGDGHEPGRGGGQRLRGGGPALWWPATGTRRCPLPRAGPRPR